MAISWTTGCPKTPKLAAIGKAFWYCGGWGPCCGVLKLGPTLGVPWLKEENDVWVGCCGMSKGCCCP